jgi:hypothetical protein
LGRTLTAWWTLWLAFHTRSNHRQRNSLAVHVDVDHPNINHIADAANLMRAADVAVRHLADVNQTAVLQADIDEHTEVDHIEHFATQFHAWLQVFELQYALAEDRSRMIGPWVTAWLG